MLTLVSLVFSSIYVLFLGFLIYASVLQAWDKLKIGIKVLLAPVLIIFGGADILFNFTIGSLLFLERAHTYTFSQRLCQHLNDADWKGHLAGAFSVPLNAIYPDHIHPVSQ
jgi:uncharacterized membrane protein